MGFPVPCPVHRYMTEILQCRHQEGDRGLGCIECPLLEQSLLDITSTYSWVCPTCMQEVKKGRIDREGRKGEAFSYYGEGECELCQRSSFLLALVIWEPDP